MFVHGFEHELNRNRGNNRTIPCNVTRAGCTLSETCFPSYFLFLFFRLAEDRPEHVLPPLGGEKVNPVNPLRANIGIQSLLRIQSFSVNVTEHLLIVRKVISFFLRDDEKTPSRFIWSGTVEFEKIQSRGNFSIRCSSVCFAIGLHWSSRTWRIFNHFDNHFFTLTYYVNTFCLKNNILTLFR